MCKTTYIMSRQIALSISSFTPLVRYMYDLCYLTIRDAASGGEIDIRLLEIKKKQKRKKKEKKTALTAESLFSMEEELQGRCAAQEEL